MKKYNTTDVFTPTKPAQYTFVERTAINNKLVDALRTPGKQLVIFGQSGSGKSTLIINKLNQVYEGYAISRCTSNLTFEQLIIQAFDQLDVFFKKAQKNGITNSNSSKINAEILGLKSELGSTKTVQSESTFERVFPIQLTPSRLAYYFGVSKHCWILEDFHKLNPSEKQKLSEVMKVFMDEALQYPDVKIIALGAVGKAKEVLEYEKELQNRVSEIHVPLMSEEQLLEIIAKGETLLNITVHPSVKRTIAKVSSGLASVTHQLCLNLCFSSNIFETCDKNVELDYDDFEIALSKFIEDNSETLKIQFENSIIKIYSHDINYPEYIIKSMLVLKKDEIHFNEIFSEIKKFSKEVSRTHLEEALKILLEANSPILKYNEHNQLYSIINPFFKVFCHCKFDQELHNQKQLQISFSKEKELNSKMIARILQNIESQDF